MDNVDRIIASVSRICGDERADPGTALARVCALLRAEVAHYDWVGYYIALPAQRLLVLGPFEGAPTDHIRIPYGRGICGQAAATGKPFVVQDVMAEANYLACSLSTKSEVVLPIYEGSNLVGELDIDSHTTRPFTDADDALLGKVVELTARHVAALARDLTVDDQAEPVNQRNAPR